MSKLIVSTLLALVAGPAFAHDGGGNGGEPWNQIQCSDPRVMQNFPTQAQADNYCGQWDNTYASYDFGTATYTCGCRTPDTPNGR